MLNFATARIKTSTFSLVLVDFNESFNKFKLLLIVQNEIVLRPQVRV